MKREHVAAVSTVLVMFVILVALAMRSRGGREEGGEAKPSAVVFDLFRWAKAGDVESYLGCLDSDLRRSVESSKRDMGDAAFREHLIRIGQAVKGVSVSEDRVDKREVRLRVELVYADRSHNDVQIFTVVRRGSRWLISSMSAAKPIKMPVPYGTPAYPVEQESKDTGGAGAGPEQSQAQPTPNGG